MRFSIDIHKNGVTFRRVERGGLHHPRIHDNAVANIELNKLSWLGNQCRHCLAQRLVLFKIAYAPMLRHLYEFGNWRCVEC
jgi:hypothetical protein